MVHDVIDGFVVVGAEKAVFFLFLLIIDGTILRIVLATRISLLRNIVFGQLGRLGWTLVYPLFELVNGRKRIGHEINDKFNNYYRSAVTFLYKIMNYNH